MTFFTNQSNREEVDKFLTIAAGYTPILTNGLLNNDLGSIRSSFMQPHQAELQGNLIFRAMSVFTAPLACAMAALLSMLTFMESILLYPYLINQNLDNNFKSSDQEYDLTTLIAEILVNILLIALSPAINLVDFVGGCAASLPEPTTFYQI